VRSLRDATRGERDEEREHLHRLAEPHVVGEADAEAQLVGKSEPADPFELIRAERRAALLQR
jgi:hypothetical protein